jgi:hypothetical protein
MCVNVCEETETETETETEEWQYLFGDKGNQFRQQRLNDRIGDQRAQHGSLQRGRVLGVDRSAAAAAATGTTTGTGTGTGTGIGTAVGIATGRRCGGGRRSGR